MSMKLIILVNINIIIFIILYMISSHNKAVIRRDIFDRYVETLAVLEKAKDIAYKKIFRDKILVYSSSGYRVDKKNIDERQVEYVKCVYKSCGPKIMEDLKIIYGDLDSIFIQLVSEFIQKVEQDESMIISKVVEIEKEKTEDIIKE